MKVCYFLVFNWFSKEHLLCLKVPMHRPFFIPLGVSSSKKAERWRIDADRNRSLSQVFMEPILHYHILSSSALDFPLCFRRIHFTGSSFISVSAVLGSPNLLLTYLLYFTYLLYLLTYFTYLLSYLLYLLTDLLIYLLTCLLT